MGQMLYIGQKRVVKSLAGYTLGDAQIDAQNRTTDQIGQLLVPYNALKSTNSLTVSYIQNTLNQIQGLIGAYAQQYGATTRGRAGAKTLQDFVNTNIYPGMNQDLTTVANQIPGAAIVPTPPGFLDISPSVNTGNPLNPTVININPYGNSDSTAANVAPSGTPGPPSGIEIPGTSVDVTATAPAWYENPAMLILVGLGVILLTTGKKFNS